MNFKNIATIAGLATGAAVAAVCAPAYAADVFEPSGITFEETTKVSFEFLSSMGKFQSDLVILEKSDKGNILEYDVLFSEEAPGFDVPKSGDFEGTPFVTVLDPFAEFIFQGGIEYIFALSVPDSIAPNGFVHSDEAGHVVFEGDLFSDTGLKMRWDDDGNNDDEDFNDFVIKASDPEVAVPEPSLLMGLDLVSFGAAVVRRRKSDPTA